MTAEPELREAHEAALHSTIAAIEARARNAQTGRWPDTTAALARMLRTSSATRAFIANARGDVLWLSRRLRRALRENDELRRRLEESA